MTDPATPPDPTPAPATTTPRDPALDDYLAAAAVLAIDPAAWPRELADLTDYLADELTHALPGHPAPAPDPAAARALAGRLVARLGREYGGTTLYLPKGLALERSLRDLRIWSDYDGTVDGPHGIEALARREGLSTIYVYRVLATQREAQRRKRQPDLFAGLEEAS